MFVLLAVLASSIAAAAEIVFLMKERTVGKCLRTVVRDLFLISTSSIAFQRFVLRYEHFLDTANYGTKDYLLFFLCALAIGLIFKLAIAVSRRAVRSEPAPPPKKKTGAAILKIVALVLFFLGVAAYTGTDWTSVAFGDVSGDQLMINLTSPTEGTEASVYIDGFEGPVFTTLFLSTVFACFLFWRPFLLNAKKKQIKIFGEPAKRRICLVLAIAVYCCGVGYGIGTFRLDQLFSAYALRSTIIDDNYVDPETAKVEWPAQKRNLIYIYLESMENTFMSTAEGGYIDTNLIPNLTEIAREGTVFSDTDAYFGGPDTSTGTQWSCASMVNQIAGVPMKAPPLDETYGSGGRFLNGAYTLGEMLEKQGYEQTVMIGASGTFGGLRDLYQNHGNWKMIDYDYALEHGMIPEGYKVLWGYEDDKLYEFAKQEILRLYRTGKPFNFTMENADTHRPDGYVTPGKETPFDAPYANALWNSDKDVAAFLRWIREQPFYDNTTVVLIGDHLTMDATFITTYGIGKDAHRTQYHCFLNPAPSVGTPDETVTRGRKWSNWDMMPTTVAALGGKIEGERLGIGTNLFSGEKTLLERYGVDEANKELQKGSEFFNKELVRDGK